MVNQALLGVSDTERLSNRVLMMRCGGERDVIRAPYDIGVTALAYQRWSGQAVGDVLAHRRQWVYFLVPPGTASAWSALLESTGCLGVPLRLLSEGALVMLPSPCRPRFVRWLRGPGQGPAPSAADVLASLRHANIRLICRGQQRVADQESAMLAAWAAKALELRRRVADATSADGGPPAQDVSEP